MSQHLSTRGAQWGLIVLILSYLTGCFSTDSTLDVGYHGSDEGYVAALEAADTWNRTCDAYLIEVHRGDGAIQLREQSGITSGAFGETTIQRPGIGHMYGPKRATDIWFTSDESGGYALPTLTHEFGHALGLGHAPTGIMRPTASLEPLDPSTGYRTIRPGEISPEDCAAVTSR